MSPIGVALVALYVVLVCTPAALVTLLGPPRYVWLYAVGLNAALTGFMILVLQVVLAARWRWASQPFGLDIVLRFHRKMAVFGACLLIAHPFLLAAGRGNWHLIYSLDQPWNIWLGRVALLLVIVNVLLSVFRVQLRQTFERWRLLHGVIGVLLLGSAWTHSWFTGPDLRLTALQILWIALAALVVLVFAHHRFIRPRLLRRGAYRVVGVHQEIENVWTIELQPPDGRSRESYAPGQFHFLTLHRDRDLPHEEHHFTISSSPSRPDAVSSTIKAVGDFTSTIGRTKPGDTASVHGAFGRFSYRFHTDERDLVFIAGGIGVTPLMSMLRCMHDTGEDIRVTLLYANKDDASIVFRQELESIASGDQPRLTLVHVLSKPPEDWAGESGHIDRAMLERHVPEPSGKTFYICGPPPRIKATISNLKSMGVRDRDIRMEIFSLVD